MSHYFRRRWEESRGDKYASWGNSWWFFETDDAYWPIRQIEVYDSGKISAYHGGHIEDEFGGLSQAALDPEEFEVCRISRENFERAWQLHAQANGA